MVRWMFCFCCSSGIRGSLLDTRNCQIEIANYNLISLCCEDSAESSILSPRSLDKAEENISRRRFSDLAHRIISNEQRSPTNCASHYILAATNLWYYHSLRSPVHTIFCRFEAATAFWQLPWLLWFDPSTIFGAILRPSLQGSVTRHYVPHS